MKTFWVGGRGGGNLIHCGVPTFCTRPHKLQPAIFCSSSFNLTGIFITISQTQILLHYYLSLVFISQVCTCVFYHRFPPFLHVKYMRDSYILYVTPVLGEQCYMKRGLPTRPQFVTKNLLYRGNNTPRKHIFNLQSSALTAWQQRCSPHETLDWRLKGQSWFDKWKRRSLEAALCTCDPLSLFPHIQLPLYLHFQTPLTQLFCPTS